MEKPTYSSLWEERSEIIFRARGLESDFQLLFFLTEDGKKRFLLPWRLIKIKGGLLFDYA